MNIEKFLNLIDSQPAQLRENYADGLIDDITADMGQGLNGVVFAGMGGSALAGNMLKNWLYERLLVPLEVSRGYQLPGHIGKNTLVVCSSYSGNTEETLSAYWYAQKMNCRIAVITSGGKLLKEAQRQQRIALELPKGLPPRLAVLAGLKALACLLADLGLVEAVDVRRELLDASNFLDIQKAALNADALENNRARDLAKQLQTKMPLIYGGPGLGAAAYYWKISINENAKQMAFYNTFPELDHNEFQGWQFPHEKNIQPLVLRSSFDGEKMYHRMQLTEQLLARFDYKPINVGAVGKTPLEQLLYTLMLGDYVSAYLAELNGVDPLEVSLIEQLKSKLA
jgi:glucose/mannose-6-phosphate isomerase